MIEPPPLISYKSQEEALDQHIADDDYIDRARGTIYDICVYELQLCVCRTAIILV
jgi:hypothetical protein